MKITIKGEHGIEFQATNPDESLKAYHRDRMKQALLDEFSAFMEEVFVTMRQLEPGESKTITSKPIVIELSRPMPTEAE